MTTSFPCLYRQKTGFAGPCKGAGNANTPARAADAGDEYTQANEMADVTKGRDLVSLYMEAPIGSISACANLSECQLFKAQLLYDLIHY